MGLEKGFEEPSEANENCRGGQKRNINEAYMQALIGNRLHFRSVASLGSWVRVGATVFSLLRPKTGFMNYGVMSS